MVGDIIIREGRLEERNNRSFITDGVTAAFANNFNDVFGCRSTDKLQKYTLNDYLAGVFATMAPGMRLATLFPLPLCPSRAAMNALRLRSGLSLDDDASFYEYDECQLGDARTSVTWSQGGGNKTVIKVFVYTRVKQSCPQSVFICCNPTCANARGVIKLPATVETKDGRAVMNKCGCGFEPIATRSLKRYRDT
jgi:hypothetical protein